MRLKFSEPDLFDVRLPDTVMPPELEAFWHQTAAPLARKLYARTGVTARTPFMLEDAFALHDLGSAILRTMATQKGGRTTMATYGPHAFRFLADVFGHGGRIEDVTPNHLLQYKARRKSPVDGRTIKPRSWNSEAAALKAMFDAVVLLGIRPDNPCNHPNLGWLDGGASVEPDEPKFITLAQFRRFRDHGLMVRTRSPLRNAAYAETLLTSGMRLYESNRFPRTAMPDQPQANAGRAFTYGVPAPDGKGHRARDVPIGVSAYRRMRDYDRLERDPRLERWGLEGSTAMWLNQSGEQMGEFGWEAVFRRASELSGVEASPHTLRHTFAVYMLAGLLRIAMASAGRVRDEVRRATEGGRTDVYAAIFGDPLRKLQRLLGHKHYETTFIYLEVLGADDRVIDEALSIFDTAFGSEEDYRDLAA